MKKSKSSISKARSYTEIGDYWDKHDLGDYLGEDKKGEIRGGGRTRSYLLPIQKDLSEKIQSVAKKQGVSSDTLVNLWLEQKIKEQRPAMKSAGKLAAKHA